MPKKSKARAKKARRRAERRAARRAERRRADPRAALLARIRHEASVRAQTRLDRAAAREA